MLSGAYGPPVTSKLGVTGHRSQTREGSCMYAFKVQVNDEAPVVGGAEDLGVLTAIVTATGKLGSASFPRHDDGTRDIDFRLGGLTARGSHGKDEHLTWLEAGGLKPGDR